MQNLLETWLEYYLSKKHIIHVLKYELYVVQKPDQIHQNCTQNLPSTSFPKSSNLPWPNISFLNELKVPMGDSMKMFCDNQVAISIVKNQVYHDRPKHVEINCHFIKEKIEERRISLLYTPTILQTADILTKALFRTNFEDLRSKVGMINIYNPA